MYVILYIYITKGNGGGGIFDWEINMDLSTLTRNNIHQNGDGIVFILSRFKGFSPARLLQYHRQYSLY